MATGSLERLPLTPTSMLKQFALLPVATHSTDVEVRGFVEQSVSCSKVCLGIVCIAELAAIGGSPTQARAACRWPALHVKRPVQLPSQMEVHGFTNPPLQSQQCVVSEFQGQVFSICEHLHTDFVLQLFISWSVLQQFSVS